MLKPFLLSCATKNAKLQAIALGCLQKLISHHAIPDESIPAVLKTLHDHVKDSLDLQLKILQTILPLLTNYDSVHGEIVADVCLVNVYGIFAVY